MRKQSDHKIKPFLRSDNFFTFSLLSNSLQLPTTQPQSPARLYCDKEEFPYKINLIILNTRFFSPLRLISLLTRCWMRLKKWLMAWFYMTRLAHRGRRLAMHSLGEDKSVINSVVSAQWGWLEDISYKHFHFDFRKPHLHPFVATQIYQRRGSAEGNVYFISVAVPILNG